MSTTVAPTPRSAGPRRGRSYTPGIYAGRYLTAKARERQRDEADEFLLRRAAFHRNRDAAYRRALNVPDGEPLPGSIGQVEHSRAPLTAKNVAA